MKEFVLGVSEPRLDVSSFVSLENTNSLGLGLRSLCLCFVLGLYCTLSARVRWLKEFPLGTGGNYKPQARHVDREWGSRKVQAALAFSPHNQFLLCLVQYGVIGLALLLLFYGGAAGALVAHWRRRWRGRRCADLFLLIAVAGAVAGYVGNSFFHDHGPFTKDWFHCVLVGLLLAVGLRLRNETPSLQGEPQHTR